MPFQRPTLSDLKAQAAADVAAALPGADPLLRFSNLAIMAKVQAALANGHYGYLDWIARQAVPFTCTGEYLEAWAALKGVTRKPPAAAAGAASFTGTNGSVLAAGAHLVRGDGVTYATAEDATIASGTLTVAIVADDPGSAGNAASGAVLVLGSAVSGINSTGAAAGAITGGSDVESDDGLRTRMLQAYASPPQGGADADYVRWALEVAGVTRAWVAPLAMGPGTVSVYFMMDGAEVAFAGFPQGTNGVATDETRDAAATGDQLAVADHIYPLRPVTALVYAVAPGANTVNYTIAGLGSASTGVKNAVKAAIADVFLAQGSPVSSGGGGGVVQNSFVEGAIAAVQGSAGFNITEADCDHGSVTLGSTGDIASSAGYLPVLGVVAFST